MMAGLLALGGGVLVLLVILFGGLGKKPEGLETTIAPYTRKGAGKRVAEPGPQGVTAQAVGIATKALESNRGLEVKLGDKLEAGGMAIKPAEWLLIHAGIAVGATAVGVPASPAGRCVFAGVALLLGILVPWMYLGRKQSKRLKAFNAQLAPTLQLMAGSLQAGLSLPQGMDTIVREGAEPMATEFRRALVETRLGVSDRGRARVHRRADDERRLPVDASWRSASSARSAATWPSCCCRSPAPCASATTCAGRSSRSPRKAASRPTSCWRCRRASWPTSSSPTATTCGRCTPPASATSCWASMCVLMGLGCFMMSRMIKLEV